MALPLPREAVPRLVVDSVCEAAYRFVFRKENTPDVCHVFPRGLQGPNRNVRARKGDAQCRCARGNRIGRLFSRRLDHEAAERGSQNDRSGGRGGEVCVIDDTFTFHAYAFIFSDTLRVSSFAVKGLRMNANGRPPTGSRILSE
jgi:hypothetical protein